MQIVIEEREYYWDAKRIAKDRLDKSICLMVDGMDQNAMMVPKFLQLVKGIEGRYVRTHLCGVLVHDLGFYCHIWVDVHHNHNNIKLWRPLWEFWAMWEIDMARYHLHYGFKQTIVHEKTRTSTCWEYVPRWWHWGIFENCNSYSWLLDIQCLTPKANSFDWQSAREKWFALLVWWVEN